MPPKWIATDLSHRFGNLPIEVGEMLAWWLDKEDWERLLTPDADFERSKAISICTNVGNGHFRSMAEEYGVTPAAMALRFMELNLVKRS